MTPGQNKSKYIRSLQQKKYRQEYGQYVVEGEKILEELLAANHPYEELYITAYFEEKYATLLQHKNYEIVTEKWIESAGNLETNKAGLALIKIPAAKIPDTQNDNVVLVLDNLNDPGNLGTIIRIADWYGIRNIICSPTTVDCYNSKVLMASKGSFLRVNLYYTELVPYLKNISPSLLYGTFMKGENIHHVRFEKGTHLVMGNEANGVTAELEVLIKNKLNIPGYGAAESLNVAIATAICCDNIFRAFSS